MREIIIDVVGMHCAACGLLIDDVMLDVSGVQTSVTDTKSGECRVLADPAISGEVLLAAVAEAGYSGVIRAQ